MGVQVRQAGPQPGGVPDACRVLDPVLGGCCSPVKCEEGVTAESRGAGAHEGPCPMRVQTAWSEERSGEAWPSVGTDS